MSKISWSQIKVDFLGSLFITTAFSPNEECANETEINFGIKNHPIGILLFKGNFYPQENIIIELNNNINAFQGQLIESDN